MMRKILNNQNGVALIVVLWVTVLLTVMVSGFIAMIRTEAQGVSNYKEKTQAYYLARSGVNLAIGKLLEDLYAPPTEEDMVERWKWDGRPYKISFGAGNIEVRVTDEGGKVDVNKAARTELVRVLLALGVEGSEQDTIVASILDWKDKNNFHHLNGAEDDYYMALPEPYTSKNGPLDTVDELMWIKGVTKEIFYGDDYRSFEEQKESDDTQKIGLKDAFTVFSGSVRVNINTAPLEVLISLPGMDEETAMMIIDAREEKDIQNMGDFARAGGELAPTISKYITFTSPKVFTVEAAGWLDESPASHAIKAVVKINGKDEYKILYWKDQDRSRRRTI
ncbi:MAG: type II secretion system protein GspK [Thermodesulfobacteriota bacterium]